MGSSPWLGLAAAGAAWGEQLLLLLSARPPSLVPGLLALLAVLLVFLTCCCWCVGCLTGLVVARAFPESRQLPALVCALATQPGVSRLSGYKQG